jgi:divalent metal cation (Fe/Co/Zn/Cd) transporter
VTLAWNVAGIVVLAIAAISARSVALARFGLDSLIEIGASTVVIWELSGAGEGRQPGRALGNPVLRTEGRVTMIDGILAAAVLLGLALNSALGWWWADPAAGYVLVCYAGREVREIFFPRH